MDNQRNGSKLKLGMDIRENIVTKGEIAPKDIFLLLPQCFQKVSSLLRTKKKFVEGNELIHI